jgi:rubrerythrin
MACCGEVAMLDDETGAAIVSGEKTTIDLDKVDFPCGQIQVKRCSTCGYSTSEDFKFCPKCGNPFE